MQIVICHIRSNLVSCRAISTPPKSTKPAKYAHERTALIFNYYYYLTCCISGEDEARKSEWAGKNEVHRKRRNRHRFKSGVSITFPGKKLQLSGLVHTCSSGARQNKKLLIYVSCLFLTSSEPSKNLRLQNLSFKSPTRT